MTISQVLKRDGRTVQFEPVRITNAISRALFDAGIADGKKARQLTKQIVRLLEKKYTKRAVDVETIQNSVEIVLRRWNKDVATIYAEYRRKKAEIRQARETLGIEEKLTYNAMAVLERRYLLRNEKGKTIETPSQMFRRVARAIASAESKYGGDPKRSEEEFFRMMSKLEFLPNSPTMFNAGMPLGQLAACFVLPIEDSLESIFTSVKNTALIEQSGGGVGFSFSGLRPKGDIVRSTMGVASGPVSFMRVFDVATDVIKAGGKRRGAMMGVLRVDHPDIVEFVTAKQRPNFLSNFNLSVAVTDSFMKAVHANGSYNLVNPHTGKAVRKMKARYVWDIIVENAWRTGDPGVIFIDEVNRTNPTSHTGDIAATNPCGEQPLHSYECCNLGSINLTKMLMKTEGGYDIDWKKLEHTVKLCVRFLDDVIDVNKYPMQQIQMASEGNRRIGLGVMGWADTLIMLGIPYDSPAALKLAEKIMRFINDNGHHASIDLGKSRGNFQNFKGSLWEKRGYPAMRNATVTTIAPTGTLSIIAGVSSGIEPLFGVSFVRKVLEGRRLLEVNGTFERMAKQNGFYSTELLMKIAKNGSAKGVKGVPKEMQKLFVTALEIGPEWHVRMQSAFQRHVDNSVSKTINFPANAKVGDVHKAYELAYKMKCKGITVYRYGSKPEQVLYIGPKEMMQAEAEFAGGCPTNLCPTPS